LAWIQDLPIAGEVTVDLHGYSMDTALAVADRVLKDAYRQGYSSVTFIHGASGTFSASQSMRTGRGTIKWGIKDFISHEWRPYLRSRRHRGHRFMGGSTTLAIQSNPSADPCTGLGDVPPADYGPGR
jgi:hypothetical protein